MNTSKRIGFGLISTLVLLGGGCGGSPHEEPVLRVAAANGDTITLTDKVVPIGAAGDRHETMLRFNNRLVIESTAEADPKFPPPGGSTPIVRAYKHKDTRTIERNFATPWNVYVPPDRFDADEFNRLATCYEANRAKIDAALVNPPFLQKRYIVRLIHAAPPSPAAPNLQTRKNP